MAEGLSHVSNQQNTQLNHSTNERGRFEAMITQTRTWPLILDEVILMSSTWAIQEYGADLTSHPFGAKWWTEGDEYLVTKK